MIGFDLAGKTVLVTGASRGIGLGIAGTFAAAGADLAILADDAAIDEAADALRRSHGGQVRAWRCDVTRPEELKAVAAEIETLDVLVNNAGLERIPRPTACSPAWSRSISAAPGR